MRARGSRIRGVDAIMIYTPDAERLARWYADHLGIETTRNPEDGNYYGDIGSGRSQVHFGIYPDPTRRAGSRSPQTGVMVNYRVANLDAVLGSLRERGVTIKDVQRERYGVFAHLDDPDGNPIELWMKAPRRSSRGDSK